MPSTCAPISTAIFHIANPPNTTMHPITKGKIISLTFACPSAPPIINCIPSIPAIITAIATPAPNSILYKSFDKPCNCDVSIDASLLLAAPMKSFPPCIISDHPNTFEFILNSNIRIASNTTILFNIIFIILTSYLNIFFVNLQ